MVNDPVSPDVQKGSAGRLRLLSAFGRDLAHAVRLLAARPAFTAVAVLTLALGIGANTAIFSVVHSMLLAPLPFPEPDRLVMLWETDADDEAARFIVAAPNFQDWSAQSTSFAHTAIWEDLRFNIAGGADPEQVRGCGSRPRSSRCSAWLRSSDAPSRRKRTRRVTPWPSSATRCGAADSVRVRTSSAR